MQHTLPLAPIAAAHQLAQPKMAETLSHRATLKGHQGWVTSISTPLDPNSDIILSSSR